MEVERSYALLVDYSTTYKSLAIMYPVGSNARTCGYGISVRGELPRAALPFRGRATGEARNTPGDCMIPNTPRTNKFTGSTRNEGRPEGIATQLPISGRSAINFSKYTEKSVVDIGLHHVCLQMYYIQGIPHDLQMPLSNTATGGDGVRGDGGGSDNAIEAAQQLHDLHGTAHLLTVRALLDLGATDKESSVSGAAVNSRYEELVDASRYQQSTYKSLDRLIDRGYVAKSTGTYTNCYWLTDEGREFAERLGSLFQAVQEAS